MTVDQKRLSGKAAAVTGAFAAVGVEGVLAQAATPRAKPATIRALLNIAITSLTS